MQVADYLDDADTVIACTRALSGPLLSTGHPGHGAVVERLAALPRHLREAALRAIDAPLHRLLDALPAATHGPLLRAHSVTPLARSSHGAGALHVYHSSMLPALSSAAAGGALEDVHSLHLSLTAAHIADGLALLRHMPHARSLGVHASVYEREPEGCPRSVFGVLAGCAPRIAALTALEFSDHWDVQHADVAAFCHALPETGALRHLAVRRLPLWAVRKLVVMFHDAVTSLEVEPVGRLGEGEFRWFASALTSCPQLRRVGVRWPASMMMGAIGRDWLDTLGGVSALMPHLLAARWQCALPHLQQFVMLSARPPTLPAWIVQQWMKLSSGLQELRLPVDVTADAASLHAMLERAAHLSALTALEVGVPALSCQQQRRANAQLAALPQLRELSVTTTSRTELTCVSEVASGLQALSVRRQLASFGRSALPLLGGGPRMLPSAPGLTRLQLGGGYGTGAWWPSLELCGELAAMTQLRYLELDSAQCAADAVREFSDALAQCFRQLPRLTHLSLRCSPIDAAAVAPAVAALKELRHLDLSGPQTRSGEHWAATLSQLGSLVTLRAPRSGSVAMLAPLRRALALRDLHCYAESGGHLAVVAAILRGGHWLQRLVLDCIGHWDDAADFRGFWEAIAACCVEVLACQIGVFGHARQATLARSLLGPDAAAALARSPQLRVLDLRGSCVELPHVRELVQGLKSAHTLVRVHCCRECYENSEAANSEQEHALRDYGGAVVMLGGHDNSPVRTALLGLSGVEVTADWLARD